MGFRATSTHLLKTLGASDSPNSSLIFVGYTLKGKPQKFSVSRVYAYISSELIPLGSEEGYMNRGALGELVLLCNCERDKHGGLLYSAGWDLGVLAPLFSSWWGEEAAILSQGRSG